MLSQSLLPAWCALASLALSCEPKLVVGKWSCSNADGSAGGEVGITGEVGSGLVTRAVQLPWSTGFEHGFCDYATADGYCYRDSGTTYETVTSPVHSGSFAAAFRVNTGAKPAGYQTRCVRQGTLPQAAYYSAYFFVPEAPTASNNWNLIHFEGADTPPYRGLWDVSLLVGADGALHAYVYDFLRKSTRNTSGVPAVPIGSWFQLEVYLKRAPDATGELIVYQDGEVALSLKNLITDETTYGRWYVGNLAVSLTPADGTLYVDDVAIRETP